jgi:hypothetical protein
MEKKVCNRCGEEKNYQFFSKKSESKDGLMSQCKICRSEIESIYRKKNEEKVKLRRKKYYDNNKDKHLKYFINKRNNDPIFKLKDNIRRRINVFLSLKKIPKNSSTFDIVGCTPQFLKEYLENKFTEGMSWGLVGKYIHIDHIIPLSSAKTEEEVIKLCHYTNLQPLWGKDNMSKGSKLI